MIAPDVSLRFCDDPIGTSIRLQGETIRMAVFFFMQRSFAEEMGNQAERSAITMPIIRFVIGYTNY
tara:strand:+ start:244 stop:441 length:198 start_codon:yes stop_codon:yes gene_type:complete